MRAAENLAALSLPLDRIIKVNRLTEIPGIGDAKVPWLHGVAVNFATAARRLVAGATAKNF